MKPAIFALLISFVISFSIYAQDGTGNTGSPAQNMVYYRANYALYRIKKDKMLPPELLNVFQTAVTELRVEPKFGLRSNFVVNADPERPGKRVVFVEPTGALDLLDSRFKIDITLTIVHEVFQTQIRKANKDKRKGKPYDVDEEITKPTSPFILQFNEKDYIRWEKTALRNPFFGDGALEYVDPINGIYVSENGIWDLDPRLTYQSQVEALVLGFPALQSGRESFLGLSNTVHLSKETTKRDGVLWKSGGELTYKIGEREYEYKVELRMEKEQFYLREQIFPHVNGGWLTHPKPYILRPKDFYRAYEQAIAQEVQRERREDLQLFLATAKGEIETLETLTEQTGADVYDWRKRTPLMVAAWTGQIEATKLLVGLTELDQKDENGLTVLDYALDDLAFDKKNSPAIVEIIYKAIQQSEQNRQQVLEWAKKHQVEAQVEGLKAEGQE